jgi:hypothetical protein
MAIIPNPRRRLFRNFWAAALALAFFASALHAQLAKDEFITRTFKLNTGNLRQSFQHSTLPEPRPKLLREDSGALLAEDLRDTFAAAGIRLDNDPLSGPGRPTEKAMFLNERTGDLFIRATRADMEKIESILGAFNKTPPEVSIETKFVELPPRQALPAMLQRPVPFASPAPAANVAVLTERQFRETFHTIETTPNAYLVSVPNFTTLSGRQVRIQKESPGKPNHYQTPPHLPKDTSPDADPTPSNTGRLPFPPTLRKS